MVSGDGEDSDAASNVSEPPDWNSDDEPPKDQVGDVQTCSRDGLVKKRIEKVGQDFGRPGQYDKVHVKYSVSVSANDAHGAATENESENPATGADGPSSEVTSASPASPAAPAVSAASGDAIFLMGQDQLPLAIEFAVKCMRLGEVAEVTAPVAYAAKASPLCGQKLRNAVGSLKNQVQGKGRISRKLRFLPAAPSELEVRHAEGRKASASGVDEGRSPKFRATVELLAVYTIHMLTEDRSVSKQVLHPGTGRRTPRMGDLVQYSLAEPEAASSTARTRYTLLLGEGKPPLESLERVLLSMKEGEECLAWLPRTRSSAEASTATATGSQEAETARAGVSSTATVTATAAATGAEATAVGPSAACESSEDTAELQVSVVVSMHCWQRRDEVQVGPPGADQAAEPQECPVLRKFELCKGMERLPYDVDHGSVVLVGLAHSSRPGDGSVEPATTESITLLSWCLGEGTVPGFLEAAVSGMRLAESALFCAPTEAATCLLPGPPFLGQTPLRELNVPELCELAHRLFQNPWQGTEAESSSGDNGGGCSAGGGGSSFVCAPPTDWATLGDSLQWEDFQLRRPLSDGSGLCFKLALLAATEAPDVCTMTDDEQREHLDRERAHGNALAKAGRFAEALQAYSRALDSVRRSPLYKSLFPTERGHIEGAYSRDPCEYESPESPLQQLSTCDVDAWRSSLVALHLNLALCNGKEGRSAQVRRHCSIVLGAEPSNSKALFRRGSAASSQGDYEEAQRDLQKAQELEPQDRAIREELQGLQRRMQQHRETERGMFKNAFSPPARGGATSTATTTMTGTATAAVPGSTAREDGAGVQDAAGGEVTTGSDSVAVPDQAKASADSGSDAPKTAAADLEKPHSEEG